MGDWKAPVLAGVLLGAASLAQAADLAPPAAAPVPAPTEFSGWYLRGDLGISTQLSDISITVSPNPLAGLPADAFHSFYNPTISAGGVADIGLGYQVNNWLRFDATAEYRGGSQFQALEQIGIPSQSSQFANWYRANISSYLAMANGYVDLGTWYGVTPFVGAGLGLAQNHFYGIANNGFAYVGPGSTGSPAGGYMSNGVANNLAWALMGGLDYNVSPNLKLELGYRYLDYGTLKTGPSHCFNGTGAGGGFSIVNCGGAAFVGQTNRLASQDFRLGLRWLFSDAPTYASAGPIAARY
ncbi:MAG TPA: outer membrane beta-barrel protein [Roseiarcus sp.]|nr:outer membrane beta-barrel protein [Roseiarcus sp.]